MTCSAYGVGLEQTAYALVEHIGQRSGSGRPSLQTGSVLRRPPHRLRRPDPAAPPDHRHFYDQIVWLTEPSHPPLHAMTYRNAGMIDFTANHPIPAATTTQLSWRISDHFPSGAHSTSEPVEHDRIWSIPLPAATRRP